MIYLKGNSIRYDIVLKVLKLTLCVYNNKEI